MMFLMSWRQFLYKFS